MSEEKVLATVAGEPITEKDMANYLDKLPQEQRAYASNPRFQQQILEQVINTRLMTKLGEEQELFETEAFKETMKNLRNDILAQMSINKVVGAVTVTDEEAKVYFESNQSNFAKGETVSAKHILVDNEELCAQLAVQIKNGEISFEDAAMQNSTCPSKQQGGDLGEFGHGQMVAEFDTAAFEAAIDDVVGPVKTQFGYHLIKVYKKSEAATPAFEEVAANVKNMLLNEKRTTAIQDTLAELRARYM